LKANESFSRVWGIKALSKSKASTIEFCILKDESSSADTQHFWKRLSEGQFVAERFKRR